MIVPEEPRIKRNWKSNKSTYIYRYSDKEQYPCRIRIATNSLKSIKYLTQKAAECQMNDCSVDQTQIYHFINLNLNLKKINEIIIA